MICGVVILEKYIYGTHRGSNGGIGLLLKNGMILEKYLGLKNRVLDLTFGGDGFIETVFEKDRITKTDQSAFVEVFYLGDDKASRKNPIIKNLIFDENTIIKVLLDD